MPEKRTAKGKAAVDLSLIVTAKKPLNLRTRRGGGGGEVGFFLKHRYLWKRKILWISQEHVLEHSSLPTSSTTGK